MCTGDTMSLNSLSGNNVDVSVFKYLSMQSRTQISTKFSFRIPSTVVFRVCPTLWYESITVRRGAFKETEIRQKPGTMLDKETLYKHFSKSDPQAPSEIVCYFVEQSGDDSSPRVTYMDKDDLKTFLFTAKNPHGLLQKFIHSQTDYCETHQAVWSPHMFFSVRRANRWRISNRSVAATTRASTFDGPLSNCHETLCTAVTNRTLSYMCRELVDYCSQHCEASSSLKRLVAYFRRDVKDQLWLLYTSSVRVSQSSERDSTVPVRTKPVSLTPAFDCSPHHSWGHSFFKRKLAADLASGMQHSYHPHPPPAKFPTPPLSDRKRASPSMSEHSRESDVPKELKLTAESIGRQEDSECRSPDGEVVCPPVLKEVMDKEAARIVLPLSLAAEAIDDQLYQLTCQLAGGANPSDVRIIIPDSAYPYKESSEHFVGFNYLLNTLGLNQIDNIPSEDPNEIPEVIYTLDESTTRRSLTDYHSPCRKLVENHTADFASELEALYSSRLCSPSYKTLLSSVQSFDLSSLKAIPKSPQHESNWVKEDFVKTSGSLNRVRKFPVLQKLLDYNAMKITARVLAAGNRIQAMRRVSDADA